MVYQCMEGLESDNLSLNSVPYFICTKMHTNISLGQLGNASIGDDVKAEENGVIIVVRKEWTADPKKRHVSPARQRQLTLFSYSEINHKVLFTVVHYNHLVLRSSTNIVHHIFNKQIVGDDLHSHKILYFDF